MSSQEEFELAEVPDVAMVMAMASASAPPPRPPPPAMIGYGSLESPPAEMCQACGHRHLLEENHEYLYRDEVDDDLICHICLQPFIRPLDTPCGHTYCQECLTSFLLESDFCPVDRTALMLQNCRKSSLLVHKLLDKLAVTCPFTDHCTDTLPRGEMEGHIKNRLSGYVSVSFMMCECDVGGPGVSGDQFLSGRSPEVFSICGGERLRPGGREETLWHE